jgi:methylase of polypeptide subunit release factors
MPADFNRLDEIFLLYQQQLAGDARLEISEPLVAPSSGANLPDLRALTISIQGQPFAILGLIPAGRSLQSTALLQNLTRRAQARKAPYLALSNQAETLLLTVPASAGKTGDVLRRYPRLVGLDGLTDQPLAPLEKIALQDLAERIARDLLKLKEDGRLYLEIPDSDYFVGRLVRAVEILKPAVTGALQTEMRLKPDFARELTEWALPQGIPADLRSPDFAEAVVRQAIYRLLGKIIFYQSLRRAVPTLPEMQVAGLDSAQVMPRLKHCFARAHQIDYHAVFREDVVDRLPYPAAASEELRNLVEDLNTRDFAHLPQDVVGSVFERLIPPEDRHALGQFFTKETLVDLILGFCVRRPEDRVLDCTCGTGSFLIRSYNRLNVAFNVHDHSRLLSQVWGVDIAPFPAELATINLFRQQVAQPNNFPRVLNEDFFNVVPGGKYRFPPLKPSSAAEPGGEDAENGSGQEGLEILEPIPQFTAIVGNFPYISAERIEAREKGYLEKIRRRLADEWLRAWPEGFTFASKVDQKQHQQACQLGLDITPFLAKAGPIISAFADLYVSLFWHAAAFLEPGGRMGIITSNAWLDVGFGYGLQQFFLNQFKIVAILESRCEPWFEQAAINTVVTILERCDSPEERDANAVRFVKIKRRLDDLIPWDMRLQALERWLGINKLAQRVEAAWQGSEDCAQPVSREDEDFRIRTLQQGALRRQVQAAGKTVKWGPYLRAPQTYFDLRRQAGARLALLGEIAPPTFGSKTGINEFFHLDAEKAAEWGIEPEFLFPLLKSPGESDRILIDEANLRLKVFVCRVTKEELLRQGKLNALSYIEWGERQIFADGRPWSEGIEVQNRKPGWYALPEYRSHPARIFLIKAYGERHFVRYCTKDLIADQRLYFLSPDKTVDVDVLAAVMNSSIGAFFTENIGRVSLGDGALELAVEDAQEHLYLPDVRLFSNDSKEAAIFAFQPLLQRPIGSVFAEVQQPDRQALDQAVLQAMGLEAREWLPRIYAGLTGLVGERTQLGQMRSQTRKARPQKAAGRVAEEALKDLLPDGPLPFPERFYSPAARSGPFRQIPLPEQPLQVRGHHFGQEELGTPDGQILRVASPAEALFVQYCQANGQRSALLPQKAIEVSRTVNDYKKYLRDLRQQLFEAFFRRTLDQAQAERFVAETWRKYHLPDVDV